jgi:hypothetical protein
MTDIIHIIVSHNHHNSRAAEAVGEMVREMFLTHGFEVVKDTHPMDSKYNPWAVVRTLPETEIRVEVRV